MASAELEVEHEELVSDAQILLWIRDQTIHLLVGLKGQFGSSTPWCFVVCVSNRGLAIGCRRLVWSSIAPKRLL